MKFWKKTTSVVLSLAMCAGMVLPALAVEYDISQGDVTIDSTGSSGVVMGETETSWNAFTETDKNVTISQSKAGPSDHTITVGENVTGTTITLDGVNIDASESKKAAMSIGANSKVTVELDGNNTLKSGKYHAGLELNGKDSSGKKVENAQGGSVTITDANETGGSLKATGSDSGGAGIGSGAGDIAGNITIEGRAQVTATGVYQGAGIGSSSNNGQSGSITIKGDAQVTATGGSGGGAGIGSGRGYGYSAYSTVGGITIKGDAQVTATGGSIGTGIGSGSAYAKAKDITIDERAQVTATGTYNAGIGSGSSNSKVGSITIKGTTVVGATSTNGPGIGSGYDGSVKGSSITIDGSSVVLLALSSSSYNTAIQLNGDPTKVNGKNVLNGSFSSAPQGVTQFVVVKADGTVVREFDVSKDGTTYKNFAINLPEGEYYIHPKGANGKFVGYGDGSKTVVYTIGDTMLTQRGLGTTESGVNWKFVSGTQGRELPDEVNNKLPTNYVDSFDPVEVEGGSWTFQSWNIGTPKIVDGKLQDVDAVGTWVFVANPTTPGGGGGDYDFGLEIDDPAIPLAEGPITRAQFIDYLWRHEGEPASAGVCTFTDVPEDHEFFAALCWGEENGIAEAYFGAEGHEDGTFEPDELVTVAAVREFLGNFADVFGGNVVAVADLTTLTGEDDEAVLNCGEVVAEFFGEEYVTAEDVDADNGEDVEIAA